MKREGDKATKEQLYGPIAHGTYLYKTTQIAKGLTLSLTHLKRLCLWIQLTLGKNFFVCSMPTQAGHVTRKNRCMLFEHLSTNYIRAQFLGRWLYQKLSGKTNKYEKVCTQINICNTGCFNSLAQHWWDIILLHLASTIIQFHNVYHAKTTHHYTNEAKTQTYNLNYKTLTSYLFLKAKHFKTL